MEKKFTIFAYLYQINIEIASCNSKIRDNCNIQAQLKKENKALRNTVKLLKLKRTELMFSSYSDKRKGELTNDC